MKKWKSPSTKISAKVARKSTYQLSSTCQHYWSMQTIYGTQYELGVGACLQGEERCYGRPYQLEL